MTGAVAVVDFSDPKHPRVVEVKDMPTFEVASSKGTKNVIDLYGLGGLVGKYRGKSVRAFVEEVSSMPEQGVASSFNFGFAAGCAHMAVAGALIPLTPVRPGVWKKAMGLVGKEKDDSRRLASRIIPSAGVHWPLKKHDGRAEAVLLAVYGSRL